MKKFLYAHYEKIILAALLIIFTALLYYSLMFIQRAQNQEVATKVKPVQKPSDYESVDFSGSKYKMETIFSEWNTVEPDLASATKTQMMTPYPMAECVYCHALIPANAYPAIGETKNGKCPACGKALAPRLKVDEDELLGKADLNSNGIPDEWEKQYTLTDSMPESDEDSDGFTLAQEYKAKTDPVDPLSHPKYISMLYVSAVRQQRINGLELVSVDDTKPDRKNWAITFNVLRNQRKRSEFVQMNVGTFKNNNVDYSVVDIEDDEKTQEHIVYIQRVGKIERIPCRVKQPVYDPSPRVTFLNTLTGRTMSTSVGSNFKLGTAKTGEELYKVVSADTEAKTAVVETVGGDAPVAITVPTAPKEAAAASSTQTATGAATQKADAPFLNQIK